MKAVTRLIEGSSIFLKSLESLRNKKVLVDFQNIMTVEQILLRFSTSTPSLITLSIPDDPDDGKNYGLYYFLTHPGCESNHSMSEQECWTICKLCLRLGVQGVIGARVGILFSPRANVPTFAKALSKYIRQRLAECPDCKSRIDLSFKNSNQETVSAIACDDDLKLDQCHLYNDEFDYNTCLIPDEQFLEGNEEEALLNMLRIEVEAGASKFVDVEDWGERGKQVMKDSEGKNFSYCIKIYWAGEGESSNEAAIESDMVC